MSHLGSLNPLFGPKLLTNGRHSGVSIAGGRGARYPGTRLPAVSYLHALAPACFPEKRREAGRIEMKKAADPLG